jgi:hypothetical protein
MEKDNIPDEHEEATPSEMPEAYHRARMINWRKTDLIWSSSTSSAAVIVLQETLPLMPLR